MRIGGIVLCGGQSKRMGRPKAWLPFDGELLLQRVVRIVGEVVRPIVAVAASDQELPPLPADISIVRDEKPGLGPLQGLAAGLAALKDRVDAVYASSCDVPLLRPAFVKRMVELLGNHAIAVPHVEERYHPLAAVYRVEVLASVVRLLDERRMRPVFLFEEHDTRVVYAKDLRDVDGNLDSLRNVNTAEDYLAACGLARQ